MNITRLLSAVALALGISGGPAIGADQTPVNEMIKFHEARLASGQISDPQEAKLVRWKLQRLRMTAQAAMQQQEAAMKAPKVSTNETGTCEILP